MARTKRRTAGRVGLDAARAWLELLQTAGPFLTAPVVERVWPQGMPALPKNDRARVRVAVAAMLADHGESAGAAIELVVRDVLGWNECLRWRTEIPDAVATHAAETGHTITADFAFRSPDDADDPDETDADDAEAEPGNDEPDDEADEDDDDAVAPATASPAGAVGPWRLLGLRVPFGTHPLTRAGSGQWASASPAERLAVLLRARNIPIGLVTDGRWWALVWAPRGKTTGVAVWDADLWSGEPETFEAFVALLTRARFLGVPANDTLPALLNESSEVAEEVTDTLGRQVRDAVELLVAKLEQLDDESGRTLFAGVSDDDVYAGVVTVMMRVVFLLFAEERRLLPSDDARYDASYSVGHLVQQLRTRAATNGEQTLEFRTGAWHRLLAISRAVFRGIHYDDLRIPAYGGDLFNPARFPWLEGDDTTPPAAIDDRTMLKVLSAVQYVVIAGETRRLTFRALDVEQIGYVYEGLLDLEVRTAQTHVIALKPRGTGKAGKDKTLRHVTVDEALAVGDTLESWTVTRYFGEKDSAPRRSTARKLLASVVPPQVMVGLHDTFDTETANGLQYLASLIRTDETDRPVIIRTGGRYLAPSTRRAATGTHYTPRSLAEEVVKHALEPLVFRPGPLETLDEAAWRLRPSSEIQSLRVADIAMGSGAFLVAACRWLADKLVEAWDDEGDADAIRARDEKTVTTADAEVSPVVLKARRLIAEHCLYGVDVNPLAVEMAKLSLWLVTMDRERPFGFLDDRLISGDSLLGLVSTDQLASLHIDPKATRHTRKGMEMLGFGAGWQSVLADAADIRRRITATDVTTVRDVEHKQRLLTQAQEKADSVRALADALLGAGLVGAGLTGRKRQELFADFAVAADQASGDANLFAEWAKDIQLGNPPDKEPRRPLHWPLAFPEVFADTDRPGFDAIVGNPPFFGGQKISGTLGSDYLRWLQLWDGGGRKGSCDLGGRFVLRADRLLSFRGQLGYVATNTLIEGDTLEVSLLQLDERGDWRLRRATSPHKWPSKSANLQIIEVWTTKAPAEVAPILDDEPVPKLTVDLQPYLRTLGRPYPLRENRGIAFKGVMPLGAGFLLAPEEAQDLLYQDARNRDVLTPYVIGRDLNQRPDSSGSRWIINFREWSLERACGYPELLGIIERKVRPSRERSGDRGAREYWWRFLRSRPAMYQMIASRSYILAMAQTSNALMPVRIDARQTFDQKTVVFTSDSYDLMAYLSSSIHFVWTARYTSTMRVDISYAQTDVFETLPQPRLTQRLDQLGQQLDSERRELMLGRAWGLTRTYNAVHDPSTTDPAILRLCEIHEQIDHAVLAAYGWSDIDPKVGHHETKLGIRWTVSRDARYEILDRLLAENHRRHALEC